MEYIAVLNNYLEYSSDDNHTVKLSFQSTIVHVFHAEVSIKYILARQILHFSPQNAPPCLTKL